MSTAVSEFSFVPASNQEMTGASRSTPMISLATTTSNTDIENTNQNSSTNDNNNEIKKQKKTSNHYFTFLRQLSTDIFLILQGESDTPVSKYLKLSAKKDWRHSIPYWTHHILGWLVSVVMNLNVFVGVFSYLVSTMQDEK